MAGKSISYYEQKRDLPEIKELRPEYHDIHSQVLQDVLLRLKRAFDRFFERVKNGQTAGLSEISGAQSLSFVYLSTVGIFSGRKAHHALENRDPASQGSSQSRGSR